jgi:acetyl-CoA carboxylase carboxyl transferase subunit alpha
LWKDSSQAPIAADALKLTSSKLLAYGLIDAVVPEPLGGAHYDWDKASEFLKLAVVKAFSSLAPLSADELVDQRYEKFSRMGNFLS